MHLLNNTLRQDLRLLTKIVANTRLFLVLILRNIDVDLEASTRPLRSREQSHISIRLTDTQPAERPDTVRTAYDLDPGSDPNP